jgi:hypothetical protein
MIAGCRAFGAMTGAPGRVGHGRPGRRQDPQLWLVNCAGELKTTPSAGMSADAAR